MLSEQDFIDNDTDKEAVDEKRNIIIKGARGNNLKNVNVILPKNKLIVVTGVSGSGKSTITMDTLFAEGQRRYVESLSSYARQFLMRMKKPEVDFIKGICPAISIEQKVTTTNARSTVGSLTEIYDFLRMLYGRVGKTYSPTSNELVKKHAVSDVVDYVKTWADGSKIAVCTHIHIRKNQTLLETLEILIKKGFIRLYWNEQIVKIEDILDPMILDAIPENKLPLLVVDRIVVSTDESFIHRISDSVQSAFSEGNGECQIISLDTQEAHTFNNRFELDGIEFVEPTPSFFNYNSPFGACPSCEGYGKVIGIDKGKVIPNKNKSIYEGAVKCWSGEKGQLWLNELIAGADKAKLPIHKPYKDLTKKQVSILWDGCKHFEGISDYFKQLESQSYKIQNRVMLARYRGRTECNTCGGLRLRPDAQYVKVNDTPIGELTVMPLDELLVFFENIQLSQRDIKIAERILYEIKLRLKFMNKVGLGYLHLDRVSSTLSGGETQRINLTRTLGSNLTDSLYILDEPSIGLHPKDSLQLLEVLRELRDLGNTVLVVEHEEDIIRNADHLLDMGPYAGVHGGEVVYNGPFDQISKQVNSLTIDYLMGRKNVEMPITKRKPTNWIRMRGVSHHNLKNIDVDVPLQALTVVSGVSGSGKTTLIKKVLFPYLGMHFSMSGIDKPGSFDEISGDYKMLTAVEMVNQNPIGKSSRSNPVTYVKAYDDIRKLYMDQQLSKIRGFKAKHFSFNVDGGRCDTCKGEGETTVEMQFLADIKLTCEDCKGKRFKADVLEVHYKGKSISDILELTIAEALEFFEGHRSIVNKIKPLVDVGLGYVQLGQSSSSLSGGEAQRVKLASFLAKENTSEKILFIFDEPTTGLHFHDVAKLLDALQALVERGHSVIVIEHNLDVIKCADWVIDLGPGGGKNGGKLMFQGLPKDLTKDKKSLTAPYLKEKF